MRGCNSRKGAEKFVVELAEAMVRLRPLLSGLGYRVRIAPPDGWFVNSENKRNRSADFAELK